MCFFFLHLLCGNLFFKLHLLYPVKTLMHIGDRIRFSTHTKNLNTCYSLIFLALQDSKKKYISSWKAHSQSPSDTQQKPLMQTDASILYCLLPLQAAEFSKHSQYNFANRDTDLFARFSFQVLFITDTEEFTDQGILTVHIYI